MVWSTCEKEKPFLKKIFSKENCEKYLIEEYSQKDFEQFEKLNFRCMSNDTFNE